MEVELRLSLPPDVWQRVREIRTRVAQALCDMPLEVRAAAVMVTGELVENAVKFGEAVPSCQEVKVCAMVEHGRVVLEVSNGVSSPAAVEDLVIMIDQIAKSGSSERLYTERIEEMIRKPGTCGRLGLFRIGYEGNFDLTCRLDGQTLTVRAERAFA